MLGVLLDEEYDLLVDGVELVLVPCSGRHQLPSSVRWMRGVCHGMEVDDTCSKQRAV